jgi:4-amino-4-deoxy-L-arabinose transferase-like glycosyltransferase
MDSSRSTPRWLFVLPLLLTLLVAAGLRLYRLPELPAGLHYDEAANGILAAEIARGVKAPIFIPSYTGKEVLFFYWTALWIKLLGAAPLALRLSAAAAGLATVAATAWAVRELLRGQRDAGRAALLTAAFLATSFWHVILSRYGFRAVTQPLLQALTIAALWRGLRPPTPPLRPSPSPRKRGEGEGLGAGKGGWLLLAGLFCGLTAYTYLAARAFPIPLAAALLTLFIADRGRRRARLGQLTLFAAAAALTLAPLAHYWLTHPGSFLNRTQQVAAADWAEAWTGFRACLRMFFIHGDPYIRFNLPHRPLFDPVTAALFLLGLATITWQLVRLLRSPHRSHTPLRLASYVLLLTTLPTMLLPSALATGEITPSNLRTVGLLPFIYIFPALALSNLQSLISTLKSSVTRRLLTIIVHCSLFIFLLLTTASAYFRDWAPSAALYYAGDGDLADVAAYLNHADLTATTPYVASIHYRHPTLAFLAEDYGKIRWLTGGKTIIFPANGEALLIFPRSASEDLAWVQSVLPDDALATAPPGPDGEPAFHVYRASSAAGLAPTHPLTADLGHAALLLGYDTIEEPPAVAIWWRVLNRPPHGDYGTLVRLADPWGFTWSENRHAFHYPSEQWTPGEIVVDHLSVPVAPDAPPGDYRVRFSFYSASADHLLPVLDDADRYAGTYVELPLHLARAATPPHPDDLNIRNRLDASADGLTLLGANLDTSSARPGERLYLALFWRADEPPLPDYDVTLTLGDATLYMGAPVHGTYPFSEWTAGEIVADRYDPRLPREVPPGDYPLRLQAAGLSLDLGTVTVQAVGRTFDAPPIAHPLAATLGDQVELLGYNLSTETASPENTLTLTLYWRALAEMDESYTVFAHLVAPDGSMAGQRDSLPVGGSYPTDLWMTGEVVTDVYEITVRADAAPGAHRLEVGMYVAETGTRLSIADSHDDAVVLQSVTITSP